jgi:ribosomal protein L6P/L9E
VTKHYRRGKFLNRLKSTYTWYACSKDLNQIPKSAEKFVKTLIVRGIGYRAFALKNDIMGNASTSTAFANSTRPLFTGLDLDDVQELNQVSAFEFPANKYLSVRAGHTRDLYLPVHSSIRCLTSKKDRKLTILSANKILAANLAKTVHLYRAPSVYTGRGVRVKHVRPIRKAGKKDKQKGRAF